MSDDRFSRAVVETIAKRAANMCSNPDCKALTTGPAEQDDKSVTIGEAAHIFGANPGSARFDERMTSAERSDSTNAIWLCRNCHKLIDADASRFPVTLLFEWRRGHEREIVERLGKPGDQARQRVLARELEGFKGCSDLAQQIVIDKPDYWEYKLTVELLRSGLRAILPRWRQLHRNLYVKPLVQMQSNEALAWFQSKMNELTKLVEAAKGIVEEELPSAWGPPGTPGSDTEILRACSLYSELCQRILEWEESVRFVSVPSQFEGLQEALRGIGGRYIDKLAVVPVEMAKPFEQEHPKGNLHIQLVFDLPDGWLEQMRQALARVRKAL